MLYRITTTGDPHRVADTSPTLRAIGVLPHGSTPIAYPDTTNVRLGAYILDDQPLRLTVRDGCPLAAGKAIYRWHMIAWDRCWWGLMLPCLAMLGIGLWGSWAASVLLGLLLGLSLRDVMIIEGGCGTYGAGMLRTGLVWLNLHLAAMLWARPWLQAVPALFLQGFLLIGAVSGVVLVCMAVIEAINQQVGGKSAVPAPDEVLP